LNRKGEFGIRPDHSKSAAVPRTVNSANTAAKSSFPPDLDCQSDAGHPCPSAPAVVGAFGFRKIRNDPPAKGWSPAEKR
jgi:hypothetical protein